jgi:hypothetical protein
MRVGRFWALGLALVVLSVLVGTTFARSGAASTTVRWDIPSIDTSTTPPSANPGGKASALTNNGLKITFRGTGTFVPGSPSKVTGGGTWRTFAPNGTKIASGKYRVTRLLRWKKAPGKFPIADNIGKKKNASAGLAVLRIKYSDGKRGSLLLSCHLEGTRDSVFEGITATRGYIAFWNRRAPSDDPFVDANRTLFHVRP